MVQQLGHLPYMQPTCMLYLASQMIPEAASLISEYRAKSNNP